MLPGMPDVTQVLGQIKREETAATERLLPLDYEKLRELAAPRDGTRTAGLYTLQATALKWL